MASAPKVPGFVTRPVRYVDREPGNYTVTEDDRLRVETSISNANGGLTQPVVDTLFSAVVVAGATVDLGGTAVAAGKTGKLLGCTVGSSVACKWQIVEDNVVRDVVFTMGGESIQWMSPHIDLIGLAGDGAKSFHVIATNLDALDAADVYATIYWDEE